MRPIIERILVRIILIISFQWLIIINCQLNLYNTDRMMNNNNNNLFEYDCLYYRIRNEKLVYQDLSNIIDELIPYCFRPLNENEILKNDFINIYDQIYTFEQLYLNNITSQQLLIWSAPIDLVEKYQFYFNEINSSLKTELFYNCTKPWFGLRCEYSFEFTDEMSLNEIIDIEFSRKLTYYQTSNSLIKLPCYIHIECDRGGPFLCLDWREICNGHVDCLDNGLDEAYCFDLELNQCNENEYRCHNGLCIPDEYWENGLGESDCLDRSDEISNVKYLKLCYQDPRFRCEEHSCRTNWHEFSCGDGECVQKFDKCQNNRHQLLIQTMINQGNLSEQCWIAMICLTKLIHEINSEICQIFLNNNNNFSFKYLQTCEDIFQFPIIPIHYGHIRFLYEKPYLKLNKNIFLLPDYICYDEQLCDCIIPTFYYKNLTCIHSSILKIELNISGYPWIDLILELNSYFSSCLITHTDLNKKIIYENFSSIYSCENSSKLISKSRLIDENKDCCMNDDENYLLSCLINDKYRIQCSNENLCLSSLLSIDDCPQSINQYYNYIPFQIFCDGFEEYVFKDLNGQIYTDESDCYYWPCNNIYSRCDGYWLCSNGEDEDNCHEQICPLGTHSCISPMNYSLICLSSEKVGDEINDCLGGSDEVYYCRQLYPLKKDYERFHCLNSDLCLSIFDLCNHIQSCPLGDDENFCRNYHFICNQENLIENILCQNSEYKKKRIIHFSIQSSIIYPSQSTFIIIKNQTKQNQEHHYQNIKTIESRMNHYTSYWYCHRGLPIRIRSKNNFYQYGCLCPPSYYGNLCQYQNERISITLGLIKADKYEVYTIILMLIDDNDKYQQINSYDQFDYASSQTCGIKFNRYLLYSTRPKNISKNYSLHIIVYEKRTMTYRGSWHLSIPFLFLPVNRLVTLLVIPSHSISISSECSLKCKYGECIKYINKEKYFCRCFSGWSGIECNQAINCQSCSSDSICIGSVNNRSICICPLTKFGPRCLLSSSCTNHACQNNGQCIPADLSIPGSDYTCICSDQFYGTKCQYKKAKLDISLDNLDIPSYLMAFFFTISEESDPICTIILEKLTLFQRIVTFRISIPYHIVIIKLNEKFYLAVVQQYPQIDLLTSINPTRECLSIENILNSTIMSKPRFQRIKFYHIPCQINHHLNCFIDEEYLCLCTKEHHANCIEFKRDKNLQCSSKFYCQNQGYCLQDHPNCPSTMICVCPECFFGLQCQFYAKGFGLTLDEILSYEIKHNLILSKQSFSVKLTAIITMIMFIIGFFNGIFSILTFKNKICQEVGCGLYLLTSSIISLIIVILFTFKFWFLFLSFRNFFAQNFLIYFNCIFIEPILKLCLYIDNWLNACIAIERVLAVFKGIYFNKKTSQTIAKWIILIIILINIILLIPQLSYLYLYVDKKEERTWCVILYSSSLHIYNTCLIFIHFFIPFFINLFSAIFIIILTAQQRAIVQTKELDIKQLKIKFKQHKHLLISPIILIILTLPRLILTFTLNCRKSSKYFWFYLIGYFLSFMPSVFIFIVFVLPSVIFRKSFKQAMNRAQRRISLFKLKFYSNKHSSKKNNLNNLND